MDVLCNLLSVLVTRKFLDGSQFEKNAVSAFFLTGSLCVAESMRFLFLMCIRLFYWLGDAVNESGNIHISSIY